MNTNYLFFDSIATIYDEVRPGYPNELYEVITEYKPYSEESEILEIGGGNGVASREIYNNWKSKLTIIEPSIKFSKLLETQFKGNTNVKIINNTFEDYDNNQLLYDGIFSATAFHWVNPKIKYRKTFDLLKNDGLLVLYWNNYSIENVKIDNKLRKIYKKYNIQSSDKTVNEMQNEKIVQRKNEITDSELFKIIKHKILINTINFSVDAYIKLLKTFPDHSNDKINASEFYEEIIKVIKNEYNKIKIVVTVNLEIAKKKTT